MSLEEPFLKRQIPVTPAGDHQRLQRRVLVASIVALALVGAAVWGWLP